MSQGPAQYGIAAKGGDAVREGSQGGGVPGMLIPRMNWVCRQEGVI
jgi:hypothetical protein